MTDSTPVTQILTRLGISYRLFRHAKPADSLEAAAVERGQQPTQIIRSLLFRLAQDDYIMVLMAGPKQVSWRALRQYLGQSRLTMASRDEVLSITGYQIGAVSPFGLPQPLRILVDESVFIPDEISIGSGERGATVIMTRSALQQALGDVEVGSFSK
jgi:Cys-tRNA(Pro) deacylase